MPADRMVGGLSCISRRLRPEQRARRAGAETWRPTDPLGERSRTTGNLPFATRLARRYRHRGQEADDLAQVAALGLVKAVDGYDPGRGKPFFGYLVPTVLGEVRRHFGDKGWAVHVGRRLQERHLLVAGATAELTQRLGRSPGIDELALDLGLTDDDLIEALAAGHAYDVGSLNAPVAGVDDGVERQDLVVVEDADLASVCDRLALRDLLARLPDRDRFIVTRYFYGSATQDEIAQELGMSQMNVSRLLRRILRTLRAGLEGQAGEADASEGRSPAVTIRVNGSAARVTVTGDLDEPAACALRDCLVDTAVRTGAQRIEVDLRGLGEGGARAVRALVDGYRATGHTATTLVTLNIPDTLFRLLSRLGVTRLFECRPAQSSAAAAGDRGLHQDPQVPARQWGHAGALTARRHGLEHAVGQQVTTNTLQAIATGLVTVSSITFSVLLLSVQQTASTLSPVVFDQFMLRDDDPEDARRLALRLADRPGR